MNSTIKDALLTAIAAVDEGKKVDLDIKLTDQDGLQVRYKTDKSSPAQLRQSVRNLPVGK